MHPGGPVPANRPRQFDRTTVFPDASARETVNYTRVEL
jgi:hypothetical protein